MALQTARVPRWWPLLLSLVSACNHHLGIDTIFPSRLRLQTTVIYLVRLQCLFYEQTDPCSNQIAFQADAEPQKGFWSNRFHPDRFTATQASFLNALLRLIKDGATPKEIHVCFYSLDFFFLYFYIRVYTYISSLSLLCRLAAAHPMDMLPTAEERVVNDGWNERHLIC